jgi:AraC-like DNA-binding protein
MGTTSKDPLADPSNLYSDLPKRSAHLMHDVKELSYSGCKLRIHHIDTAQYPPRTIVRPHRHSHYEVIFILSGHGLELPHSESALEPGTVQLHIPQVVHGWHAPHASLIRLGIAFTLTPAIPLKPNESGRLQIATAPSLAHDILTDALSLTAGRSERQQARFALLLAPALNMLQLPAAPLMLNPLNEKQKLGTLVRRFLEDNLSTPLTLNDIAAQFALSVPTLTRRFRQETGTSIINNLNDLRMRQAAKLLRETQLSIKETAFAVGIPEPSYFCRCFRRAFGETPARFQEREHASR